MSKTTTDKKKKKRNAQDATREYDVKPLRKRIVELERQYKSLNKYCAVLHKRLGKLES